MPPRKKATTKNDMIPFEDELAKYAKLYQSAEQALTGGGNKIGLEGGVFTYQGEVLQTEAINAIVLSTALEHAWYPGKFDSDAKGTSPYCWAVKLSTMIDQGDEMVPSEKAFEPVADTCAKCEYNKFGSSDNGKGKACRQRRRLAIVLEDDLEKIGSAELAFMTVPTTSGKAWSQYVKELALSYKRPPFGVVTEIRIVRDPKVQFRLEFKFVRALTSKDSIGTILENKERFDKEVLYDFPEPNLEDEAPKKKAPAKKKAAKKTTAKKAPLRTRRK